MFHVAATAADFPSGKAEPTKLGKHPMRRRQRRMRGNLPGPEGLARRGASAALHGLPVVTTTGGAARLASAPSPCQRGSREILRQAPWAIDVFGGSSSGRTTVSDTVYLGSNPSPPANLGPTPVGPFHDSE